ncbi:hypothetical protein HNQ92_001062 [Rhabdobacter roseus]|uniref:Uncharacterized protein n=1 Tax=Rhabdobacter roseus TaxID=1655419 RepID=A0A840TFM4_9BACT|nr:hypothetical protein [Rhabdobacter roseus]
MDIPSPLKVDSAKYLGGAQAQRQPASQLVRYLNR